MNEEVKIKISQPMFEVGELERFDNNIHNIIEEYSKLMFKEKDQILTQRIIMKQEQEIERLKEEYMMLQNASDKVEEELQQRIDKAIFFINKFNEVIRKNEYLAEYKNFMIIPKELLDILKGSEKSEPNNL